MHNVIVFLRFIVENRLIFLTLSGYGGMINNVDIKCADIEDCRLCVRKGR